MICFMVFVYPLAGIGLYKKKGRVTGVERREMRNRRQNEEFFLGVSRFQFREQACA